MSLVVLMLWLIWWNLGVLWAGVGYFGGFSDFA